MKQIAAFCLASVLLSCASGGQVVDAEPRAARPLTDAAVRALFARCSGVTLTSLQPGSFSAVDATRAAVVKADDACLITRPTGKPITTTVSLSLVITDAASGEELSTLKRAASVDGIADCEAARAQLQDTIAAPSALLCSEGLHPDVAVPLDLTVLLQPTFQAAGPLSLGPQEHQLTWTVAGTPLLIEGTATCTALSRDLDGDLRMFAVALRFDVTNPDDRERIGSSRLSVNLLGVSCDKALAAGRAKLDKAVATAFNELRPRLPK